MVSNVAQRPLPLWQPSKKQLEEANLTQFGHYLKKLGLLQNPYDYATLHQWSIDHSDLFWSSFWDYTKIKAQTKGSLVVDQSAHIKDWQWFPEARLNFSENLLCAPAVSNTASNQHPSSNNNPEVIVSYLENGTRRSITREQLDTEVNQVAHALLEIGIKIGDRVAGFHVNKELLLDVDLQ